MRALSSTEILQVWELGEGRHPLDQALLPLAVAEPELSWEAVVRLPLGQRDSRILALCEATFGPRLDGLVTCPACAESLEFTLPIQVLRVEAAQSADSTSFSQRGYRIRFRLPNSEDMAAIIGAPDPEAARALLLARCVDAEKNGRSVPASQLPTNVVDALEMRMAGMDPQAEIVLELDCPTCEERWQAGLDSGRFLWEQLAVEAQRLLREVHVLASAYGWSETEILALSPARRQAYLTQVLG